TILAVFAAKAINDAAIDCLRGRFQRTELGRVEIADRKGANRAEPCARTTDLQRLPGKRVLVGRHELGRPWQAGQGHFFESCAAELPPGFPVTVDEAVNILRRSPH